MKLRPEMVAPLNDIIWINDSGLDFLKCNFRSLLKYVTIWVYHLGLKGFKKVHSDFPSSMNKSSMMTDIVWVTLPHMSLG